MIECVLNLFILQIITCGISFLRLYLSCFKHNILHNYAVLYILWLCLIILLMIWKRGGGACQQQNWEMAQLHYKCSKQYNSTFIKHLIIWLDLYYVSASIVSGRHFHRKHYLIVAYLHNDDVEGSTNLTTFWHIRKMAFVKCIVGTTHHQQAQKCILQKNS